MGKANPTAMLLSAASMLDHLSLYDERDAIRRSIYKVLKDGKVRTPDLGGMRNILSIFKQGVSFEIFDGEMKSAVIGTTLWIFRPLVDFW